MEKSKREKLNAAGWTAGSAKDFLNLTPEESRFIEMKIRLGNAIRIQRVAHQLSQVELAKRLHSSQSRVAKMEAADTSVTMDLLLRALLTLGATREDIAMVFMKPTNA